MKETKGKKFMSRSLAGWIRLGRATEAARV